MTISMATLMMTCAPLVHPTTLRALIEVESAGNPYAVSVNHPAALSEIGMDIPDFDQPHSVREALQLTHRLAREGFSTSVGLAQINIEHLTQLNLHLADLFNPCINLVVAQRVLLDCDRSQGHGTGLGARARLDRTLSCYNAGNFTTGVHNHYAAHVSRAAVRHLHPATRSTRSAA
jgi:type IV secretion system protein VirB1